MGAIAGVAAALRRLGGALFGGGRDCAPRKYAMRSQIVLVLVLGVSGCGGTSSRMGTEGQDGDALGLVSPGGAATGAAGAMLVAVSDNQRIRNTVEATAARQSAIRTELSTLPLLKELALPDLSEEERAEKRREVERLRERYRREMAPVEAFHKELESRLKEAERIFARKDPEVERMRQELASILKRKGSDEREEIERVQREFERRRQELDRK